MRQKEIQKGETNSIVKNLGMGAVVVIDRKKMKNRLVLSLIVFGILNVSIGYADESQQLLTLPKGDPAQGRLTFTQLKCNSCHMIASDNEMTHPITGSGAPVLGLKQSRYKRAYLADSIVFPSHIVVTPEGHLDPEARSSRMGDFSDTLTIRQVTDLVAYLKQLDEEV